MGGGKEAHLDGASFAVGHDELRVTWTGEGKMRMKVMIFQN